MINQYYKLFLNDIHRRIFEENQKRIHICLNLIPDDQLWYKPNPNVNSIGNLVLHLCGNIRQYILAGIFREKDIRERDKEFTAQNNLSKNQVRIILDDTLEEIKNALKNLTPEMLLTTYSVQGFEENGTAILIHVTEHFSYHVGQITQMTKWLNNLDTGYYSDLDLNVKSS